MTKIKALSVIQCRDYALEQHGPEGFESLRVALPPATRQIVYVEPLVSSDWIEVDHAVPNIESYATA
jgi:hypothetical protein